MSIPPDPAVHAPPRGRPLEFAALTSKRTARISELSGGMKRRLILARALVNVPICSNWPPRR